MEELDQEFTEAELEGFSYRILQLLAKARRLPSNIKKIHLIRLIYAKQSKTQADVDSILQQVRWERLQLQTSANKKKGVRKKMRLQTMEVSSTNICHSPPIDLTPKRSMDQYSPELPGLRQTLMRYNVQSNVPTSPKMKSDRVLRSYNMKRQRPNYSMINDSLFGVIRATEVSKSMNEAQISIVSHEGRFPRLNVTARCVTKKYKPSLLRANCMKDRQPLAIITKNPPKHLPVKRTRALSGIYPIATTETQKSNYEYIQSIGFRRTDGRISKINALVQKPKPYIFETPSTNYRNVEVTIQDIINSNIDAQTFTNPSVSEYTVTDSNMFSYNMPALTEVVESEVPKRREASTNTLNGSMSVYYHKKIRAEQIRTKRSIPQVPCNVANEYRLPKIHDVFSKFSDVKDFSRPLYVQVSKEADRLQSYPIFAGRGAAGGAGGCVLEGLYTLRHGRPQPPQPPLLQLAPANTRCVYTTAATMTAAVQGNATVTSTDPYPPPPYEQASQYGSYACTSEEMPRVCDPMHYGEQDITLRRYHEALNTSNSSLDTQQSQDATNAMVEDALELISQDGDYMERIGMDVQMQCIICSWAGPKVYLEIHLRNEHSSEIQLQIRDEWSITYKLGTLVNQPLWLSSICEWDTCLYAISVKYFDPDCFMCSITAIESETPDFENPPKKGTITLYNKVTGEPFIWHGLIQPVSTNMPFENDLNCFKLPLSKLELLPNSANVRLHSRSLVRHSPGKVVIGQLELHDIHIIIFVKIQDA